MVSLSGSVKILKIRSTRREQLAQKWRLKNASLLLCYLNLTILQDDNVLIMLIDLVFVQTVILCCSQQKRVLSALLSQLSNLKLSDFLMMLSGAALAVSVCSQLLLFNQISSCLRSVLHVENMFRVITMSSAALAVYICSQLLLFDQTLSHLQSVLHVENDELKALLLLLLTVIQRDDTSIMLIDRVFV